MIRGDASEFFALAARMATTPAKTDPVVRSAMSRAGQAFANDWRSNAVETSGQHGRHYPNSIDSELVASPFAVAVDVGPNAGKPQGSMGRGFEFGSVNQPPHLDGLRALDKIEKRLEGDLDSAVRPLLP